MHYYEPTISKHVIVAVRRCSPDLLFGAIDSNNYHSYCTEKLHKSYCGIFKIAVVLSVTCQSIAFRQHY